MAPLMKKKNARIAIHADRLRFPVSPTLYGLFFEEISHAGDGGLYAELIRNRSFEDTIVPQRCQVKGCRLHSPTGWESPFEHEPGSIPSWHLIKDDGCDAGMSLAHQDPLSEAHPVCLRVESKASGGGRIAVVNEGFWGIPVKRGVRYPLSFYARKDASFPGTLEITLESRKGQIYASGQAAIADGRWRKHELTLTSEAEDAEAVLVIATRQHGVFELELVSLFPEETWLKRRNGMRPDLVHRLQGLKPSFLRFPGGCFVEGFSIETASRWKKTIGDLTERSSHWTLWHYMTTNGLGYHEYLQFAEDFCLEMMFVVNCGLTCQGRPGEAVPMEQLDEWVQDMLDAVEYANGPVTSRWGALRAAHGHPRPFGLKYIEIGNENFGPDYNVRYNVFYRALKARYPEIVTIWNVHWEVGTETNGLPVEIADEHFYPDAEFFRMYHDMYDSYDRSGPKIYVGEYGQIKDNFGATLGGALSEAAFMTGMERNQDVVIMSSYAPLLANVRHTVWNPDLIYFNGTTSHVTPSYHVQKMFGENRGDVVLEADVQSDGYMPRIAGGLSLSEPELARVKDLVVRASDGTLLYRGNQQADAGLGGNERVHGVVRIGESSWRSYTAAMKVKPGDTGIKLRLLDNHLLWEKQNYFQWEIIADGRSSLVHINGFSRAKPVRSQKVAFSRDEWIEARIEVSEAGVRCYWSGELVHEHRFRPVPYLTSVTSLDRQRNELIVKLVNASRHEMDAAIEVSGANVMPQGEQIVLTSEKPTDNNSMDEPERVSPVAESFRVPGSSFRYELPPNCLVVLRLPLR